jgi:hypothetical protein
MDCSTHRVKNTVIKRLIPYISEISSLADQVIKLGRKKLHLSISDIVHYCAVMLLVSAMGYGLDVRGI